MGDSNQNRPNIWSVYLVTYSQEAEAWTRETFANTVVSQFESAEARVRDSGFILKKIISKEGQISM